MSFRHNARMFPSIFALYSPLSLTTRFPQVVHCTPYSRTPSPTRLLHFSYFFYCLNVGNSVIVGQSNCLGVGLSDSQILFLFFLIQFLFSGVSDQHKLLMRSPYEELVKSTRRVLFSSSFLRLLFCSTSPTINHLQGAIVPLWPSCSRIRAHAPTLQLWLLVW
ncbi:hypothetical protein EDB92DRAFT_555878 [Lactarius akahatsu]|uniref:Uncharacterized protein n=1 Tax=Lactarius akahatsu TaxID=416441 RepID=A0AAD4L3B9_9AGAM|nr:hypothetical protein EDB92DRAFT_555878 [Lactarius akahatsu]